MFRATMDRQSLFWLRTTLPYSRIQAKEPSPLLTVLAFWVFEILRPRPRDSEVVSVGV